MYALITSSCKAHNPDIYTLTLSPNTMSSSVFFYDPSHEFDRLFNEAFDARLSPFHGAVQRYGNATGDVAKGLRPRYVEAYCPPPS